MSETEKQYNLSDLSNNWNTNQVNQIRHVSYKTDCTYNDAIRKLTDASWNSRYIISEYEKNKIINIVIRQTSYTRDEATKKLYEYKGDYEKVIKEYLGIENTKDETITTVNQSIFKEMRNFMDTTKNDYEKRKKYNKLKQAANNMISNSLK
tara:strand:- start:970 stop:1422 length:453 start_codon:yes stop_codon:yes gene_type:complete